MSSVLVMGIDPGFSSLGYAFVRLGQTDTVPVRMGLIRTKKSSKKLKVLASDDNFRRSKEIVEALDRVIAEVEAQDVGHLRTICVESMSFPRNSSSAAKVAMVWGILAKMSVDTGIPVLQARPQEIKETLCHKANASKVEVRRACETIFGKDLLDELVKAVPESSREHPYDGLAAVVACLGSETVRLVRKMLA